MSRGFWIGVLGLALAGPVAGVPLADAPTGLAWSAREVVAATAASARKVIEHAEATGQTGCRSHCNVIAEVWARLLAELRTQPAAPPGVRWQLVVVQSEGADAFAVPGGTIVLGEGFVRARRLAAAEIAFVVAHEAVHVLMQHERQTLTAALSLLPHDVPRSVDDVYVEMDYNLGLLRTLEPVLHQVEFEADEMGLLLAALAGFDPREQITFMVKEAEATPRRTLVATHPDAGPRLLRLQERLPLTRRLLPEARAPR